MGKKGGRQEEGNGEEGKEGEEEGRGRERRRIHRMVRREGDWRKGRKE